MYVARGLGGRAPWDGVATAAAILLPPQAKQKKRDMYFFIDKYHSYKCQNTRRGSKNRCMCPPTFSVALPLPAALPPLPFPLPDGCRRLGSWRPRGDNTDDRGGPPFPFPGVRGSGGGMRSNAVAMLLASSLQPPPLPSPPPPLAFVGEGSENMCNRWPEGPFSLPSTDDGDGRSLFAVPPLSREPAAALADDPTPPLHTLMGSAAASLACPCVSIRTPTAIRQGKGVRFELGAHTTDFNSFLVWPNCYCLQSVGRQNTTTLYEGAKFTLYSGVCACLETNQLGTFESALPSNIALFSTYNYIPSCG